jgi:tRNA threonylcarbamoyladenosine biosynthesis protein TsaB
MIAAPRPKCLPDFGQIARVCDRRVLLIPEVQPSSLCHPDEGVEAERGETGTMYLLGIDTCGPSGSVAVGRLIAGRCEVIAQRELAGRTYSATLISAAEALLKGQEIRLRDVGCIVAVNGPGSFTGVRVGLSAAKGLAEGAGIPVVAVSRLEVLADKAGVSSAALDAHRHEVFLRIAEPGSAEIREFLAGSGELARLDPPSTIAVCDESAATLLLLAWPAMQLVRAAPPSAADALPVAAPAIGARNFAVLALLDGHYLRRSDAEIFGNTVTRS